MLERLHVNDARKATPVHVQRTTDASMDKLDHNIPRGDHRASDKTTLKPDNKGPGDDTRASAQELETVRKELEAAKSVISRQKQEIESVRNFRHTMDQALPSPSEAEYNSQRITQTE